MKQYKKLSPRGDSFLYSRKQPVTIAVNEAITGLALLVKRHHMKGNARSFQINTPFLGNGFISDNGIDTVEITKLGGADLVKLTGVHHQYFLQR